MGHINTMKTKLKNGIKNFCNDESAQGMTEYILLVVVIVGLVTIFKNQIRGIIDKKMGDVSNDVMGFQKDN